MWQFASWLLARLVHAAPGSVVAARRVQTEPRMFMVKTREGGLFGDRSSPEFMTLVTVAVGLGVGIILEVLRRRKNPR